MSQDAPKGTGKEVQEGTKADQIYDPRDLVIKPGYAAEQNVDELLSNPAVAPQSPNQTRGEDNREDLRRD